jgi:GNAT superfamily N-acetyltransferase
MDGSPSLYIDRSPAYTRFFEHLDPYFRLVVAETRDGIVGSIAGVRAELRANGRPCGTLCIRDLKVAPAFRRRTVAYRLVRHLISGAEDQFAGALALFAAGNARARTMAIGRAALPAGTCLANLNICNVFTGLSSKRVSIEGLRALQSDDAEPAADILGSRMSDYALGPAWSASVLLGLDERLPGFEWHDCWGVENRGRLVAILCSWNPASTVAYRVVSYRGLLGAIERITRPFGQASGCPMLAPPGQPLRFRVVVCGACRPGWDAALAGLFTQLASQCRREGLTHFTVALAENDYRSRTLPRTPRVSLRYVPYFFSNRRLAEPVSLNPGARVDLPLEVLL